MKLEWIEEEELRASKKEQKINCFLEWYEIAEMMMKDAWLLDMARGIITFVTMQLKMGLKHKIATVTKMLTTQAR